MPTDAAARRTTAIAQARTALASAEAPPQAWGALCRIVTDSTAAERVAVHDADPQQSLDVICHRGSELPSASTHVDSTDPVALSVDERLPIVRGMDGAELPAGTQAGPVRAAFPIVTGGYATHVLAVDFGAGGATPDELALLGDLAEAFGAGIRCLCARQRRAARDHPDVPDGVVPPGGSEDGVIATAVVTMPDLTVWEVNAAVAELVGVATDDLVGEDVRQWVEPDDRPRLVAAIEEACHGPLVIHTVPLVAHDGRRRWCHLHLSPLVREASDTPTAVRLQVVGVEVEGRRGSRAQLRLQNAVLQRAARHEPFLEVLAELCQAVADTRTGTRCTLLLVEDGFLHHAAAPGMPASFIEAVDGMVVRPGAGACGTAAHRGAQVVVSDTRLDPLFDEWRPLAMQLGFRACWSTPVVDERGEVLATLATYSSRAREPTDEERALHETAAHMAAIVIGQHHAREREARLTGHLEAANAGLVRANQAKDEFLSMTSHELRTPLTPMTGVIETLKQRWHELPESDLQQLLGALERHTVRMRQLVDDLLTMSRAAAGSLGLQRGAVDMGAAIDEAVASLFMSHRHITVDCPPGLAVEADAAQVHQVLVNYLSNSAKYAPDGTITVTCRLNGTFVRLSVEDDGPGVPADLLPSLFDPFTQADRGDRRTARGTGLGLAVVRAIATAHGGRAWYTPRMPGPGSGFHVELPAMASSG